MKNWQEPPPCSTIGRLLSLFCSMGLKWKLLGMKGSCLGRNPPPELLTVMGTCSARGKMQSPLPALQQGLCPTQCGAGRGGCSQCQQQLLFHVLGVKGCKPAQNFHTSSSSWRVSKPSCSARQKHTQCQVRAATSLTQSLQWYFSTGQEKPKSGTPQAGLHLYSRTLALRSTRTISGSDPCARDWTQVT